LSGYKTGSNRWQLDFKTEKVTSLSPGRGTLTNKLVPKPKKYITKIIIVGIQKSNKSNLHYTRFSNKSNIPTRCQQLTTVATLMCGPWRKAAEMGTAHS